MLRLEFDRVTATLENVNLRTEKVGPDKVGAVDLKLSVPSRADVLAYFSPTLKAFLFDEKSVDLIGGMALRDSHLQYPLVRDDEMTGAGITVDYGVGDPMVFEDVRVNQFRITPVEGGSVIIGMRVQLRPSPEQVAKFFTMLEQGVTLTLTPAELPSMEAAA